MISFERRKIIIYKQFLTYNNYYYYYKTISDLKIGHGQVVENPFREKISSYLLKYHYYFLKRYFSNELVSPSPVNLEQNKKST